MLLLNVIVCFIPHSTPAGHCPCLPVSVIVLTRGLTLTIIRSLGRSMAIPGAHSRALRLVCVYIFVSTPLSLDPTLPSSLLSPVPRRARDFPSLLPLCICSTARAFPPHPPHCTVE